MEWIWKIYEGLGSGFFNNELLEEFVDDIEEEEAIDRLVEEVRQWIVNYSYNQGQQTWDSSNPLDIIDGIIGGIKEKIKEADSESVVEEGQVLFRAFVRIKAQVRSILNKKEDG